MARKQKPRLKNLLDRAREARTVMGEEKWLAYKREQELKLAQTLHDIQGEFDSFMASPECKARDALEEGLETLKANPDILQSDTCVEILDAVIWCVRYNWYAKDAAAMLNPIGTHYVREKAKSGGRAKTLADPKQIAKSDVFDCWQRWSKNQNEYKSKSAFAKAMMEKYEALESQRVIERWCKKWEDELSQ